MTEEYDVIIIGAGANGLMCGSYLAKAGAKVAIVEKNPEQGGGLLRNGVAISPEYSGNPFSALRAQVQPELTLFPGSCILLMTRSSQP